MNPTAVRGLLVALATFGGSVFISGAWLMVGLLIAGKATGARAGFGMMVTLALTAATFLAGIAVVYRGLGRVGVAGNARWVSAGAYGLAALVALGLLAFMTLVAFNR
ncbi:hypothetical protein JY651_34510 [Pyxidicoccus parkwayensis]|uniref:Transmembrane protein n=1 Tax=Pyxidicoccus parkwayensis TaxID=2813578 RepID=A0ABX7NN97_9BACT|nr:hypothetical protein [Pyxidicoccus parkwaysis]QSQ20340.1 hypothetical protein JY651_34510 [Pyxidicoccus parkwaysis]